MEYAYYPGCSLHATAREYNESTMAVLEKIKISESEGVDFIEVDNWNCCGALETTTLSHTLAMAVPARNLALAAKQNRPLAMLCNACFFNHVKVNKELQENQALRDEVSKIIHEDIKPVAIKHFLEIVVRDIGLDNISKSITKPLNGLKVAPYYGCVLLRPSKITAVDDHHNPSIFESLIETLGGEPVNYSHKAKCCGGSLIATNENITYEMTRQILVSAKEAGADCIATICPLCQMALESIYLKEDKKRQEKFDMPIFYFTQLMGIAFGLAKKELGLGRNFVSNEKLLSGLGVRK
jgi:heterodisulfide reductase subunit B